MPQEFKLILKHADEPGYTPDIECYLRHGGYDALKKALAIQPKDLPDGKKQSPQEQIRDDVKLSGLREGKTLVNFWRLGVRRAERSWPISPRVRRI